MSLVDIPPCNSAADVWARARRVQALRKAGLKPRVVAIAPAPEPSPLPPSEPPPSTIETLVAEIRTGATATVVIPSTFPRMVQIISAAAEYFHVDVLDFLSPRRTYPAPYARQIGAYLAIKLTPLSLMQISRVMHRDHTTIIHARDRIADLLADGDQATQEAVNALTVFLTTGVRDFPPWKLPEHRCRRRKWSFFQDKEFKELWARRMPMRDIAETMGRTFLSVKLRAHRLGLIQEK